MGYALCRKDNLGACRWTAQNWVAVKELELGYYFGVIGIYIYIHMVQGLGLSYHKGQGTYSNSWGFPNIVT